MAIGSQFENIYKGKKILVTGDTGFKGSWLSTWLHMLGADVYGYSLPCKSDEDNFSKCHLNDYIKHWDGDIRDKASFVKYFQEVQPDIAFHLAAQPIVLDSYTDPQGTFDTNLMGTVNFFEGVRLTPSVKAAVNITSDKCYKNNEWVWGYRENEPMGGDDPYSASKGCSELITNAYLKSFFSKENTCNIASVRAGNVIGGGDWAPFRIVPDFFRALKNNEALTIRNPFSTRPWQHVLEPLSGYLLVCSKLYKEGKNYSGGWNFGPLANEQHPVKELIEKIIAYTGKGRYKTLELANKPHEAILLGLDISKAMNYLNWKPVLDFQQTLEFTADGYLDEFDDSGFLAKRKKQIDKFCQIALNKNINWVK